MSIIPLIIRVESGVVTSVETSNQTVAQQIQYYVADEDVNENIFLFDYDSGYVLYECSQSDEDAMQEYLKTNRTFKSLFFDKNGYIQDHFHHSNLCIDDFKKEFFENYSQYQRNNIVTFHFGDNDFKGKIEDVYFEYDEEQSHVNIFYIISSSFGRVMLKEEDIFYETLHCTNMEF